jgi:hypothetical protein
MIGSTDQFLEKMSFQIKAVSFLINYIYQFSLLHIQNNNRFLKL